MEVNSEHMNFDSTTERIMPTITLDRPPTQAEHDAVALASQQPCECEGDRPADATCKPCAARSVLNGVVTLAGTLKDT